MKLRQKLNEQPLLFAGIAGGVLLIAVLVFLWGWISSPGPYQEFDHAQWYYDTQTRTLFTDASHLVPPFDHQGNPAVRAWVGSCGDCSDPTTHRVLWLEQYSESARPFMEEYVQARLDGKMTDEALAAEDTASRGLQIRSVDDPNWIDSEDPRAQAI